MKRIIITYGLISGMIAAALMLFVNMPLVDSGVIDFNNGEVTGYTTMVIALSLVFFGVKTYRDKHANGVISFGKGVKVGLLISLIAAVIYALSWEVSFSTMYPDFMTKWTEHQLGELKASGASELELQKTSDEMAMMMEYYKNPFIRFAMTIVEILPVGLVITLISAALLRKKEFLPATEPA
ncbi:MAG TPA: DUF4199 domain-containing protein [Cyclobacteriaceae bacterium]|nr:DUF4199 domain-containing protein [Cyclobacteriaceae bacterium]